MEFRWKDDVLSWFVHFNPQGIQTQTILGLSLWLAGTA